MNSRSEEGAEPPITRSLLRRDRSGACTRDFFLYRRAGAPDSLTKGPREWFLKVNIKSIAAWKKGQRVIVNPQPLGKTVSIKN